MATSGNRSEQASEQASNSEDERIKPLILRQEFAFSTTGSGGDPAMVLRKSVEPLKGLEAMFEAETCQYQARKKFLAATFNAEATLQGKGGSLKAKVVGQTKTSSSIVVNDKTTKPVGHNLNKESVVAVRGVKSKNVSLDKCKGALGDKAQAKTLANQARCRGVGKVAAVSVIVSVSTTTIATLFRVCYESYSKCESSNPLVKIKAGLGALATSAAWQAVAQDVFIAGGLGFATGLLGGFAEALTEHAHIFTGISYSVNGALAVGYTLWRAYKIFTREDLCVSLKWAEFVKELGQLGLGFIGGMIGSSVGGALLAGIPGMILGGVLGCIFGTLMSSAWTWGITVASNRMQLGDRSALAELGFRETGLPIFRIFYGESWQGNDDTRLLLRVLSNPDCASAIDIENACQLLDKKYRQMSRKKHPDKGGSHEDFVKLQRSYEALRARVQTDKRTGISSTKHLVR